MKTSVIVMSLVVMLGSTSSLGQGVPEIPDPQLPDIAMVTVDGWGRPIIIYNPNICQQAGPALCEFYKWHEYGHIMMGHTLIAKWPQIKELEADCWAAKNAPPYALQAAYQWFLSGGGSSPVHGFGPQRAERIARCAGF
jgi:hypothetical protein